MNLLGRKPKAFLLVSGTHVILHRVRRYSGEGHRKGGHEVLYRQHTQKVQIISQRLHAGAWYLLGP